MTPWRPYADDPLFTPELTLGFQKLPPADAERLISYLEALAAERRVLHTAVAFNAVYFGYDLDYGGYVGGPIDFDRFPVVEFGTVTDALPVGAMLNIATGPEPVYAEVVYKEGAHPALEADGSLSGWLSGAPAGAIGPAEREVESDGRPVLTERVVVDFDAFGQGLAITRERLDRLRRRGRRLDADGHLLLTSRYPSKEDAEADDLEFYLRYLLGPARRQLLEGPLPMVLAEEAGDIQLATALRGAMHALSDALSAVGSLRRWRHYSFTRKEFARRLGDDGPLGGGDLRAVASALGRPPDTRRRSGPVRTVTYTAIGPRLRTLAGAARGLAGIGYAVAVCHANAVLSDDARREQDEAGMLPSGVHLRFDDPWQGGGVWRSSFPAGPYAQMDPLNPLGLGWLEQLPAESVKEEESEDGQAPSLLSVSDSQLSWTLALRLTHTLAGVAPLPEHVADEMAFAGLIGVPVRLSLAHDGYELDPADADQTVWLERGERGLRVTGVDWPLEFFPGIILTFTWPRGAPSLNAMSTLLESPVLLDEDQIKHRYDPRIVTRDQAPGCARRGQEVRPLNLRTRVLRAIRRVGLLDADGAAVLPRHRLAAAVFGEGSVGSSSALVDSTAADLIVSGELSLGTASLDEIGSFCFPAEDGGARVDVLVWRPTRVPAEPPLAGGAVVLGDASGDGAGLERYLRPYEVQSFLRRLPPGRQASDKARAEYRRVHERFGFGAELPAGYTLVLGHERWR